MYIVSNPSMVPKGTIVQTLQTGSILVMTRAEYEALSVDGSYEQTILYYSYSDLLQRMLDAKAQEYGYDHILSAVSYADDACQKFAAEGAAFKTWRSLVWQYAHTTVNQVKDHTISLPTLQEFVDGAPDFVPPPA